MKVKPEGLVYGEPDLSGSFPISDAGEMDFPLLGVLTVSGMTANEVSAMLQSASESGAHTYTMPFTTDAAAASNAAGTETLSVTGLRLVDGVWYGQIVGATTNHTNAFPEPGAAVYSVLSGSFDQMP